MRYRKSRNLCTEMCTHMACFNFPFTSRKGHYYFLFCLLWTKPRDGVLSWYVIIFHFISRIPSHFRKGSSCLELFNWKVSGPNVLYGNKLATNSVNKYWCCIIFICYYGNQKFYYSSVAYVWVTKLVWKCGFFRPFKTIALRELWLFYNLNAYIPACDFKMILAEIT